MKRDSDILHEKGDPHLRGGQLYSMLDLMGASITCDGCGRWQRLDALETVSAREAATRKGWQQDATGRDRCPVCSATLAALACCPGPCRGNPAGSSCLHEGCPAQEYLESPKG